MLPLGFGRIVTTIPRRFIDRCRNVDFSSDEQCPVFLSLLEELCASSRGRIRKEFIKLVDEEPTPVMRIEMEKLVRELPGDPEIVTLFQNINEAGPLPSR